MRGEERKEEGQVAEEGGAAAKSEGLGAKAAFLFAHRRVHLNRRRCNPHVINAFHRQILRCSQGTFWSDSAVVCERLTDGANDEVSDGGAAYRSVCGTNTKEVQVSRPRFRQPTFHEEIQAEMVSRYVQLPMRNSKVGGTNWKDPHPRPAYTQFPER